ncbi:MAG: aminotransferase class V-fold PLP-dependent enzyme, partial [Planctomycetes bacterium]|nr:aminotransferase class V-fold PLP-dependent enzyme [Planctomycetota bacterium]
LQDVPALVATVRAANPAALVLMDACQGTGKRAYDLHGLGVDAASIAGHKFGAPKGVGVLYVRNGQRVDPLVRGGRQQQDRRSGTEDVAAACALAAALDDALAHADSEAERQRGLLARAWSHLARELPACRWLAHDAERLANTMSLAHPGVANEVLVQRLDLAGVAVSTGAACMAGRGEPSHVIAALGIDDSLARSVIRVSIGPATRTEAVDTFVASYVREVRALVAGSVSR